MYACCSCVRQLFKITTALQTYDRISLLFSSCSDLNRTIPLDENISYNTDDVCVKKIYICSESMNSVLIGQVGKIYVVANSES